MESLWLRARSGDTTAAGELLAQTQKLALAGARSRGSITRRTDPEDAAQVALLFAYTELVGGRFSATTLAEFKVWIWRQGRDRAYHEIRRHRAARRSVKLEDQDADTYAAPSSAASPEHMLEVTEQIASVVEHFGASEYYPQIIDLLGQGCTRVEIAERLGITLAQVGCRIKKIRQYANAA